MGDDMVSKASKQDNKDYIGVQEILANEYGLEAVSQAIMPSMRLFKMYRKWVCWADGPNGDERWLGFCPLHDRRRRTEGSAVFDFDKNVFWCNGEDRCTPGRSMTLQNLHIQLAELYLR